MSEELCLDNRMGIMELWHLYYHDGSGDLFTNLDRVCDHIIERFEQRGGSVEKWEEENDNEDNDFRELLRNGLLEDFDHAYGYHDILEESGIRIVIVEEWEKK